MAHPLPTSDVDIAVLLTSEMDSYQRFKLEAEIQRVLENSCQLSPIDVRIINDAPIMVQGKVVQTGVRIYERDRSRRVAYEVLARKKYFDFLPTVQMIQNAAFKRIRERGLSRG